MKQETDFTLQLQTILNRKNVQLQSFALLDKEIKLEFFQNRNKAILIHKNKVYEREINLVDDTIIDVFDTQLIQYLKRGQLVLLVLPSGQNRYVFQTSAYGLFADRIRLQTLDPRKNKRFILHKKTAVNIRQIADATSLRIREGELRSFRQVKGISIDTFPEIDESQPISQANDFSKIIEQTISKDDVIPQKNDSQKETDLPIEPYRTHEVTIEDLLYKAEIQEQADDFISLKKQPYLTGFIINISIGGVCIEVQKEWKNFFEDQLLAIESDLKHNVDETGHSTQIKLFLFGVVRHVREDKGSGKINLQFLSPLPIATQFLFPEN